MAQVEPQTDGFLMGWEEGEVEKLLYTAAAIATVTVAIVIYTVFGIIGWIYKEPIIKYTIATPKRPEDATILENPSIKAPGSTEIQCYAPATGEFLGFVNPSTAEGIDRAIEKTQAAQDKWVRTTFSQRRQVLRCIQAFVMENQEEICRIACLDSGKTMVDATLGEILVTVEKLRWTILHGEKALQPSRRPTNLLMAYKKNTVQYDPLGIVAALVSWNYPVHNLIGPMISAIFSGNGIIVKASENTAWSAGYFTLIVKGALHVCGHDANLVQTVITWPETANHLTCHPSISHVTFIGSRPVAKLVAAAAAKTLTPIVPELGGKDAAVILDTAEKDLPRIIEILLRGTFQASGQNCIGIERIIACPKVYDKLVLALEPRIRALRVGSILDDNDVDMGAMISGASFDRLESLIQGAVRDGARLLVGGKRYQHPVHRSGHYFQPTFLVDVTKDMAIANEECFGPICVLMRAKNPEDSCDIANAPNFGLGASVFGEYDWPMKAMIRNLRTGMVAVNDFAAYYAVQLPFGGVGGSGYGRFAAEEGLRGLCNVKAVCEDRFGWAGVKTAIPPRIRYPIADTKMGFEFVRAVTEIGYGMGVKGRVQGLKRMWKSS
ncbi:putative aldehyde dehydrogenase-like protein C21C3 [Venustampulla echinocandica]|uniref:aldehyde dehydrogenase (NAD(+)) n=1 Tax=Venustampulla echinocandica TaxID=2656787 RepID=A0A370TLY8_9HELO|nr:putative aldehyde dehydrogenase-like protein C21C3 [Venustampulla echinocandica]RDL36527.1 putative aldehyde dehydrogenase-like protein C21C3 [Venustampulla echinocandica]